MSAPWIIYTRVSDDDQIEGASLDAQAGYCRHWLLAKGVTDMQVISDEGYSAWRPGHLDRPGLQRIMTAAGDRAIGGLVVWKMDRWCRKLRDLLMLLERLDKMSVAFASVTEQIDTSSAVGRFQAQLLGALAELESGRTSERIRAAMLHIRSKGGHVGGRAPAGLQIVGAKGDRKLIPLQPHAEAVAQVWAQVLAGATLRDVAGHLTAATVPCHGAATPWTTAAAHKLISNPAYVGRLVTQADWDAAIDALDARPCPIRANRGARPPRPGADRIWLLAGGIGRCGGCGSALTGVGATGASNKTYYYYRCSGRAQRGVGHCRAKDLPAEPWELAVVEALQEAAVSGTLAHQLAEATGRHAATTSPLQAEQQQIQLDLDRLRAEVRRLIDMAATGTLVADALADGLADRQRQIVELTRSLTEIEARLSVATLTHGELAARAEHIRRGLGSLTTMTASDQAEAIKLFVREVRLIPHPTDKHSGEVDLSIDHPEGREES
jgi:site-specific DNA recombinase